MGRRVGGGCYRFQTCPGQRPASQFGLGSWGGAQLDAAAAAGQDGSGEQKAKGSPFVAAQAGTPNLRTLVHVPQPLQPLPAEQMATAGVHGGRREAHGCLRSTILIVWPKHSDAATPMTGPIQQLRIWRLERHATHRCSRRVPSRHAEAS